jgi:hypothetical protein
MIEVFSNRLEFHLNMSDVISSMFVKISDMMIIYSNMSENISNMLNVISDMP